ncbi:STAS domain-containing protein [Maridesulfovibrio sp.]|uniref:STAS domain-containing protein n=1 Tax=Maridesulfovibrio sp. TaxID=2795000 RepID=UPI002A188FB5|nr:STAS domain-containing protein [Maridesulfovibrio sp.]
MENHPDNNEVRLAFGLPFHSMDFNDLMLTIGKLPDQNRCRMFFTVSRPWLMAYAGNPLLCPSGADLILAADSNLAGMLAQVGVKIKMPLEYFEFPEQIARICAHYGFSMLHVSDTALKTDILVSDGYVPLSWELFTNFRTSGKLDQADAESITASARDLNPDIILLCAPPESLGLYAASIFNNLKKGIMICVPQDTDRNRFLEKMEYILTPSLLIREEQNFIAKLEQTTTLPLPSSILADSSQPNIIKISGILDSSNSEDLIQAVKPALEQHSSAVLDFSETTALSRQGLESIYSALRLAAETGSSLEAQAVPEQIQNTLHRAGLAHFMEGIPGILSET